jgi:hypothetical protein
LPSLHELQRALGAALLCGESAEIAPYVVANGIEPAARVRIYRNNVRENFLATLRATYPVIERLVGADYFRQMAFEFQEGFPSSSGNLHHVGERLPEYLEGRFASSEYAYLPHVARLEWAYQEVLVASEHAAFDVARLQQIAPADYPHLIFHLHPSARLVASRYPILEIWRANQADSADRDRLIDLRSGGEHLLLLRTAHDVELRALDPAEFAFVTSIANGTSLALAAQAAAESGEFDVGTSLRRLVAAGAVVDFTLPEADPTVSGESQ